MHGQTCGVAAGCSRQSAWATCVCRKRNVAPAPRHHQARLSASAACYIPAPACNTTPSTPNPATLACLRGGGPPQTARCQRWQSERRRPTAPPAPPAPRPATPAGAAGGRGARAARARWPPPCAAAAAARQPTARPGPARSAGPRAAAAWRAWRRRRTAACRRVRRRWRRMRAGAAPAPGPGLRRGVWEE